MKIAGPTDPSRDQLVAAHAALLEHFTTGVGAYEGLVAAAGDLVAETGRLGEPVAIGRLVEATDRRARHRRRHLRAQLPCAATARAVLLAVRRRLPAGSAGTRT